MEKPLLLVVDDEPAMGELVGQIGGGAGYESLITSIAKEFQEARKSTEPAVVVIDLFTPATGGLKLIMWLSEQNNSAPIILVSGDAPVHPLVDNTDLNVPTAATCIAVAS